MDSVSSHVSFIGIVDFTEDARWVYASESVQDLLGFEPRELIGRPSLGLVHPDELAQVRKMHYDTIKQDKAATLAYLRMKHKDPCKGYILCSITRTVCQNVLVGSVSFASPGPRAMHNNSTAQEVTVITPSARDFEFRRWNDPNPMPPCPILAPPGRGNGPDVDDPSHSPPMRFNPLPHQSVRTSLILDRFSERCGIHYCANDSILPPETVMGRSFFDFVTPRHEDLVRNWIDVVKGWGVNERGQPSDGGFGFGKFAICVRGRDSSLRTDVPSSRTRRSPPSNSARSQSHPSRARSHSRRDLSSPLRVREYQKPSAPGDEIMVDAIFSAHSDGLLVIIRKASSS
ncbi:unnamed protein product [Somion occarium]|uniref:PAS domain-containing protein n=1 Tax=Somion occarium TaxID=3059160 RepID=A0ABP1E197_9APHY